MALSAGAVVAQFDGDFQGLNKGLQDAQSKINGFTGGIQKAGNNIGKVFETLGDVAMKYGKIVGVAGVGALTLFSKQAIDQVSQVQNASAGLRAYEKDAGKVSNTLSELVKFAQSDMGVLFQRGDLFDAASTLKLFGANTDDLVERVKIMSKAVAGGKTTFQDLSTILGRVSASGKLTATDFDMLIERGIGLDKKMRGTSISADKLFEALDKSLPDELLEGRATSIEGQMVRLRSALRNVGSTFLGVNEDANGFLPGSIGERVFNLLNKIREFARSKEFLDGMTTAAKFLGDSIDNLVIAGKGLEGLRALIFEGDFRGSDNLFGMGEDSGFVTFVLDAREAVINFNDSLQPLIQSVKSFFERYIIAYIPTLQLFLGILLVLATQVLAGLKGAWEQLKKPVGDLLMAFIDFWETVQPLLQGFLIAITIILVPAFQYLLAVVVQVFSGIITAVSGALNVVTGIIKTVFGIVAGIMTGDFSAAAQGFKQILNGLKEFLWGATKIMISPFRGFIDAVRNILQGIDFFGIAVNWINSLIAGVKSKAGGIGGAIKQGIGNMLPEGLRKLIPGFADGVRNFGGGMAIVGERGPELVNLPKGSDVFSNEESRRMTGGQGITIETMNIKSGVDWEVGASYLAQKLRLS
jgi:hypothetical protein